jgi:hypothetical protein
MRPIVCDQRADLKDHTLTGSQADATAGGDAAPGPIVDYENTFLLCYVRGPTRRAARRHAGLNGQAEPLRV